MTNLILKQLPYDLSGQASLALTDKYLKRVNLNVARMVLFGTIQKRSRRPT
jgi:hypothetical protein